MRVGSLNPALVAILLGAAVAIAAFSVGFGVAALILVADRGDYLLPTLIGAGVVVIAVGAVSGWAVWQTVVDHIDWPRLEAEQRLWRIGALGRARVRARRTLDGRDDSSGC